MWYNRVVLYLQNSSCIYQIFNNISTSKVIASGSPLKGHLMVALVRNAISNPDTMNEIEIIRSKIYEIRGMKVMFDFDLAEMYGVETSQLKRAVRRNMSRFDGEDFMFELTKDELSRCQFGTLKTGQ